MAVTGSSHGGNNAVAFFAALYVASFVYLDHLGALPFEEAGTLLVVLGIGFSLLAWVVTLGIKPPVISILRPRREAFVALLLVVAVAAYLVFGRTWVDSQIPGRRA